MAEKKKPTCFIIMPITTPESMIEKYGGDKDHFKHVLEVLFIPAIDAAGFVPVSPLSEGSPLIHADIIEKTETADLAICDISCENPNVFFEFGIRTSLDKPICIVKDDLLEKAPFDTGILSHQEYLSSLNSWQLESQRLRIKEHIEATVKKSKDHNPMWTLLGMKSRAKPVEGGSVEDRLDYMSMQVQSLSNKLDSIAPMITGNDNPSSKDTHSDLTILEIQVLQSIEQYLPSGTVIERLNLDKEKAFVTFNRELSKEILLQIRNELNVGFGLSLFHRTF